ncbi:MAG: tRNA 2-thiouridine(34) synthase MnmA [Alphaproteobacteria bacterium]|nr:tRNA 2-thiouridine(34) synthase MnmA [Alphaproteobacteria bacterium]
MLLDLGFSKPRAETRIIVAMSGGVDSSVTAALLHEAGYDVVGLTMQLYDHGQALQKKGACCAGQDIYDARQVAEKLGFPHYVLDFESVFKESVIDNFADSYMQGYTPLPCVRCNQTVKFRDLLTMAKDLGGEALATGHYVRRTTGVHGPELHQAGDDGKDQSFFLFTTTPDQLDYLRFPLGDMPKSETRAHAERLGLKVADKPDSQDICFVPNGRYADVVAKLRPGALESGDIVDIHGNILGQHKGTIHYTIGQRRGLGISHEEPLYVVKIDAAAHRVVVGPKEMLACQHIELKDLNLLVDKLPIGPISVKIRSTQKPLPATLKRIDAKIFVELHTPEYGVAPGQACVFYQGTQVLGGGWIEHTHARF